MNCEQIRECLTGYALGDLDAPTAAEVRTHLEGCNGCRAALREIEPTLDMLRDALAATSPTTAQLSAASRARIVAVVGGTLSTALHAPSVESAARGDASPPG